ncbi:MAG TPA: ABC transporter ATP-binding protein [Candidatus Limnocylindria bacterium]|nr:ABC transporter ATP-binding protein [Candidatus Limnocylindria bacterium]
MTTTASEPLVRVRDVFKIYREGDVETVALRGANLDIERGTVTSLVGRTGSGKSTLLTLIAGLQRPSAGQILLDGRDVGRLDEDERSRIRATRIGIVFQSGNLIPFLTARENVEAVSPYAGHRERAHAQELLESVGVANLADRLPRQLSGGEAQRVAVAVALANAPDLLLADELTGELDSATADQIVGLLLRLQAERGLTILLVTHNPDVAARAQRMLVVSDGTVRAA